MTTRVVNLFGELGLEGTLRKILAAVTYPRDSSDRLRVIADSATVSGTVTSTVNAANTAAIIGGTNIVPYSQGSWNNHDIREEYMVLSQQNFQATRNRWTIT
jgi:hypothetical protein